MNKAKMASLMARMKEAAEGAAILRQMIVVETAKKTVEVGHVYMFKRQRCFIDWLVVKAPENKDFAFVVPRDHGYLEVGILDIKDPICVVRCNFGHWVEKSLLLNDAALCGLEGFGHGDDSTIQEARTIVGGLFALDLPDCSEEQDYISDTDEYRRRMRRIERSFSRCTGEPIWS